MEIRELVKKLRNCGGGAEGIKLVNEASDPLLENTPCNECFDNDCNGFEWRGNNV